MRSRFLAELAVLAALSLTSQVSAAYVAPTLVRAEVAQGVLEGESLGEVLAFRGIPYAAAPVGNLRFQPPQPPKAWTGVKSALDMGPSCPQLIDDDPTENNDQVMAEDCLSLNVWTPRLDANKRPVMVWIHGGAFVVGSSRNTYYDGAHLAARGDVVVVSLNYRLGAWGFLSLEGFGGRYASSANIGLQDQVAALQWVRSNIAKFGGDPEKVTIFGESAGASSVGALLSMPVAKGLFARAILESGVPSKRPVEARERSARLAREFLKQAGVSTPDALSTKSMRDLLDTEQHIFNEHSELGTFVPWVDGTVLKEQPFAVVASGRGNRVPIMIGTTAEEMRYFSTAEDLGLERKPKSLLMKQLETAAGPRAQDVFNTYQRLYPNWGDMTVQISSDVVMRFRPSSWRSRRQLSSRFTCTFSPIARTPRTRISAPRTPWRFRSFSDSSISRRSSCSRAAIPGVTPWRTRSWIDGWRSRARAIRTLRQARFGRPTIRPSARPWSSATRSAPSTTLSRNNATPGVAAIRPWSRAGPSCSATSRST